MPTSNPPNINHRRFVDLFPKEAEICLLNVRAPKEDVFVSESCSSLLRAPDVISDKTPPSKTHNEHTEMLLEVSTFG